MFKDQKGFVALMSAVTISAVLLIVVFSLGYSGFMARFNVLDSTNKQDSYELAEACANMAILRLIEDPSNLSAETRTFGSQTCQILTITATPPQYTIPTKSVVSGATTNLEVIFNLSTNSITSWKEI